MPIRILVENHEENDDILVGEDSDPTLAPAGC